MSNLVTQAISVLGNPKPYVFGIAIGFPILVTLVSAFTDVLLKEEVREGRLATSFIYKGKPSDSLRSWLILGKVFLIGLIIAPIFSFPDKTLIVLVLLGTSLIASFLG